MVPMRTHRHILLIAAASLAALLLAGCTASGGGSSTETTQTLPPGHSPQGMSTASTATAPTDGIVVPPEPVFETPTQAVMSYLSWVTFAYQMANSDVATATFSPEEEVRINSYVQLNREKDQRIRQALVKFVPGKPSKDGTRTLVPASETWEYQYLQLTTVKSISPTYTASYDTTYTLIEREQGGWIVDSVEATPRGEVK